MKPYYHTFRLIITLMLAGALLGACTSNTQKSNVKEPVDYVNPYVGNISHMLVPTFPTVHLPNSMLRMHPARGAYTDVTLDGLPLLLVNHRFISAFHLMPFQGKAESLQPEPVYHYDNEEITPYSYRVFLEEPQCEVRFGVSHQSAMYRLHFKKKETSYIALNSGAGKLRWDGSAISGYRTIDDKTTAYVYLQPEQKPEALHVLKEGEMESGTEVSGNNATLIMQFAPEAREVPVRYGVSFISEAQAKANMEREVQGSDLAALHAAGRKIWNEKLGKIEVEGGTEDQKTVFYTALYRTFERPVSISEDGRYFSGFDGKVHEDNGTPFYTDDWLWDSYRAHHPLNALIEPQKEADILHSFVRMAEQMDNFWAPIFPGVNGNRALMNSNHIVGSFLDAHRKGITGFDLEKAYRSGKNAITEQTLAPWSGDPAGKLSRFYQDSGYIPALKPGEEETLPEVDDFESRQAVAVTLGTAYDEWCLAQMAQTLGKEQAHTHFAERALNYRKLFHPETHFFHPKDNQGKFIQPFSYKFSGGMGARDYYDENNGWTYRWDVVHNVADLIDLMGGREPFTENLDALFEEPLGKPRYQFYAQFPDQSGNVGQFSMGNEPSFHIPYLYNYAGKPWKAQKRIRMLLRQWFRNDLMGIPGDEDGGSMSAFVVFSMMGFYPVTPGIPAYNIGSPVFNRIKIHLENGKTFEIVANNNGKHRKYIQSASLNGKALNKPWFTHKQLPGAKLVLKMDDRPNKEWGSAKKAAPPSFSME